MKSCKIYTSLLTDPVTNSSHSNGNKRLEVQSVERSRFIEKLSKFVAFEKPARFIHHFQYATQNSEYTLVIFESVCFNMARCSDLMLPYLFIKTRV